MWTVCITSIRHVLKLNGYGGPQAKVNGKSQRFKGVGNFSKLGLPGDRKIALLPFVNCGLRNYAMVLALFFFLMLFSRLVIRTLVILLLSVYICINILLKVYGME